MPDGGTPAVAAAVFGVARSGTTALFATARSILAEHWAEALDTAYEPLLWDRAVFHRPLAEFGPLFQRQSSLSPAGMALHARLPLFVDSANVADWRDDPELMRLCRPAVRRKALLIKLIRACGRMRLLRELMPDAPFVLIVRDPVAVVNSLLPRFSLFGDEYHASDWHRFRKEAERLDLLPAALDEDDPVAREAAGWLALNQAALDFATDDERTLVLFHDAWREDRVTVLERLANHLGGYPSAAAAEVAAAPVSGQTTSRYLADRDLETLAPFASRYAEWIQRWEQDVDVDPLAGWHERPVEPWQSLPLRWATAQRARRELAQSIAQVDALRERLEACNERATRLLTNLENAQQGLRLAWSQRRGEARRIENRAYARRRLRDMRFWLIDIPRTSTTTLRRQLSAAHGKVYGKTGVRQGVMPGLVPDHLTAREMRDQIGPDVWALLTTLTVVRNPWERTLSLYLYRRQLEGRVDLPFAEYVERLHFSQRSEDPLFVYPPHHLSCCAFIDDDGGEPLVEHVVRFEERDRRLADLANQLDLPALAPDGSRVSETRHDHYSRYYDQHSQTLVGAFYADDIERFGYRFDRP